MALVPAVLGERVPEVLVAPHRLQHVGRGLGLARRLAVEEGEVGGGSGGRKRENIKRQKGP